MLWLSTGPRIKFLWLCTKAHSSCLLGEKKSRHLFSESTTMLIGYNRPAHAFLHCSIALVSSVGASESNVWLNDTFLKSKLLKIKNCRNQLADFPGTLRKERLQLASSQGLLTDCCHFIYVYTVLHAKGVSFGSTLEPIAI